jgi:hypothetical protein
MKVEREFSEMDLEKIFLRGLRIENNRSQLAEKNAAPLWRTSQLVSSFERKYNR